MSMRIANPHRDNPIIGEIRELLFSSTKSLIRINIFIQEMNVITLAALAIVILAALFLFSLLKKLLKIALIFGVIALVLMLVTKGSIDRDFLSFQNNMGREKMVLLEDNGKILAGFVDKKNFTLFGDVASLNALYKESNLEDMKKGYYQLLIFNIKNMPNIKVNNKLVSHEQIENFYSEGDEISSITFEDLLLEIDVENPEQKNMQAALFAYLYERELKMSKSPLQFFSSYKRGNIKVYPESLLFQAVKILPLSWMEENINKLRESVEEKLP